MGRGANRGGKVARIDWAQAVGDPVLLREPFEGFNNLVAGSPPFLGQTPLVDSWLATFVNGGTGGAFDHVDFEIVGAGAGSAFAPGDKFDGAQALRMEFDGGESPGPNPTAYVSHTFTGLPALTNVIVTCQCGVGFWGDYNSPALTPIGIQVGAASAYLGAFNVWQKLSVAATTDGSGNLTVKLGVFAWTTTGDAGLERFAFWDDLVISLATPPSAPSGSLTFWCDVGESYPQPRKNSTMLDGVTGRIRALAGIDDLFKCTARRIPAVGGTQDDGNVITGWDDAAGWQQFLVAARDQRVMTFYPDVTALGTSYPVVLVEPIDAAPPDKDGQKKFKQDLTLRSLTGPVLGY